MNYQHAYHAGCIADVFKHIVIIQLLKSLHKKSSAFTYFETHAGNAIYDLQDTPAQKTLEFQEGIAALWDIDNSSYPAINEYMQLLQNLNHDQQLRFYPGSSLIARQFLRADDAAILCELHPDVYLDLRNYFKTDPQVHVHHRNGYEALTALLPPKTKRGLVLIDPPYEITDEFQQILHALAKMQTRWLAGMYAVWFPIKQYETILEFYDSLRKLSFANILAAELWITAETEDNALKGSGLVIINPPWQFDEILNELLPNLSKQLNISSDKFSKTNWLSRN